jgi:ATP-dependent DNA ligase
LDGKYPSVIAALSNLKTTYLCGVDDAGLPSFAQTQAASDGERGVHVVYYAFDLLHIGGHDVSNLPLVERKALLGPLVVGKPGLQFNGHDAGDGELILQHAGKLGFEGVISETIDAPYAPGNRGLWRKAKALNRQDRRRWLERSRGIAAPPRGTAARVLRRRRQARLCRKTSTLSVPPPRATRFGSPLV